MIKLLQRLSSHVCRVICVTELRPVVSSKCSGFFNLLLGICFPTDLCIQWLLFVAFYCVSLPFRFASELEEIFEMIVMDELQKITVPQFQRIRCCFNSSHSQVLGRGQIQLCKFSANIPSQLKKLIGTRQIYQLRLKEENLKDNS
ncbi:hypothetical protein NC653_020118 [Populus alba x Populus x berolinensis]|uniref:Uncharacterized protein n=1 Tax=Populus alba x Populus x berolinensis TaxID=444605 RepID=A0AAD6QC24_9ROSI|nr:hypothetical protein NC653_020118 [Populus alba x Populus x berolinensis]